MISSLRRLALVARSTNTVSDVFLRLLVMYVERYGVLEFRRRFLTRGGAVWEGGTAARVEVYSCENSPAVKLGVSAASAFLAQSRGNSRRLMVPSL